MNILIFKSISKRFTIKSKLLISSLTYNAILALVPTIIITNKVLDFFSIQLPAKMMNAIDFSTPNSLTNSWVLVITFVMISRMFLTILKNKFSTFKSSSLSLLFSILLVAFLAIFLTSYALESTSISYTLRCFLIIIFMLITLIFFSKANLKYSIIFSFIFSAIINVLFYFLSVGFTYLIDYDNLYGILAPIFLAILTINIFIYITFFTYISAEEFTRISKIKFVKM